MSEACMDIRMVCKNRKEVWHWCELDSFSFLLLFTFFVYCYLSFSMFYIKAIGIFPVYLKRE